MNSATSKILSILLVICVGTSLFTIVYHLMNQKYVTETAILTTANNSAVFKGIYIRDEEVVRYGGTGVVSYCVSDGGKLGSGSAIAEIYSDEKQIDIKQSIACLNEELSVLKKIQNPGTLESAQPANISALINEKYKLVVDSRERTHLNELLSRKSELLVLLSTYQRLTDAESNFRERISTINAEIVKLEAAEAVPLDTIISDHSAYFVSYADGYEDKLTSENIDSITIDTINEVQDSGPVSDQTVIGKLINSYEWYIAGVIDSNNKNFEVGDKVNIKLQSTSNMVDGIIHDIKNTDDPDKNIIIVKCDEVTYDLVQHRKERVEIISGEPKKGISVPRKAVRIINDTKGVYVKLGERISFKQIDVIYESSDYVLSSLDAGNGYLALYDDIVVEGVDDNGN